MNNKTLYLAITLAFSTTVFAQDEQPKAIDAKDMIEKVDRADIESDDVEVIIDDLVPAFEIPKIELNQEVNSKPISSQPVEKPAAVDKPNKPTTSLKKKNRVLASNRAITKFSQLKKNDKVVLNNAETYIYRLSKNNIIKYKYKGDLPLDSKAFIKEKDNNYVLVDKTLLISGESKPEVKKEQVAEVETTDEVLLARKDIEKKFNSGNEIKRTLGLKGLQINDTVYVFENVQLVTRRNANIAGLRKYWLIEKLDPNNSSVKEISKNKYQIYKRYK